MAHTAVSWDVAPKVRAALALRRGGFWLGRVVLVVLVATNAVVIVAIWLAAGGLSEAGDTAEALGSAGRITALLGAYLSLIAVLLLARVPLLERTVGFGRLTVWHGRAARGCLALLLAHTGLSTAGLTIGDRTTLFGEIGRLISQYPGVITATAGLALLVAVAVLSARGARRQLRYETWYLAHLYAYLGIALAFSHQIATGKDFVGNPAGRAYWIALYLVTLGALVLFRLARPIMLAFRHRLCIERVVEEVPGVVSIEITGRRLQRLDAQPGQFFLWRFLTRDRWWQAHPFSLSAAPRPNLLRITVNSDGDFSASLREIRPGTRVLAEGPLGTFTAAAARSGRVALIAGGTGITAVRALLESIAGEITLLYRPIDRDGKILFRDEIDELANVRGVQVHYLYGEDRALSADVIRQLVPDIAQRDAFVCGSPAMVQETRTSLIEAGCRRRRIFAERFGL
jgi:predicted ferric reductase